MSNNADAARYDSEDEEDDDFNPEPEVDQEQITRDRRQRSHSRSKEHRSDDNADEDEDEDAENDNDDDDDAADENDTSDRDNRAKSSAKRSRDQVDDGDDDDVPSKPKKRVTSVPNADEDEDAADRDDEEDEDEEEPRSKSKSKTKSSRNAKTDEDGDEDEDDEADGDEDEEEDDDDEDEDEEEEQVQRHGRKRNKGGRNRYLDIEAEVEDEDEEEPEEDEELPGDGFVADEHPDDEGLAPADEIDDRRHRELDQKRQVLEHQNVEQIAATFKEKYGRNRAAAVDAVVVPQRLLLPSVEDPTIWGVRCKPGKEREIVFAVTKRIETQYFGGNVLTVTSAFERGGQMAGYVYVEARKQADIITMMDGISNAYPRTNMVLVPIQEMPDLLRVQPSKPLEPGMYVRIKRGKYQGDLAQVEEVETNGSEVDVRLVPREDYGYNDESGQSSAPTAYAGDSSAKRKRGGFGKGGVGKERPPQKLFNDLEAKKRNSRSLISVSSYNAKHFSFLGNTYIDGYLIKTFKSSFIQSEDVQPTLEEITKFASGGEDGVQNLDLTALQATLKAQNAANSYVPGDMIEIYIGEQRGVIGKAVKVHGDIVTLEVTEGPLRGRSIDAPVKGLRKKFTDGDHVKVIGGSKYQDETGMVVRIKDERVTLITDSNTTEITVFSRDLRLASDSGGIITGSKYDLYDLVQLDVSTVGCVVKVDRESLKVLDQLGQVRTLLPSNISNKLERRKFAVATDKDGAEVRNDDTVKEVGSEQRQGRIMHIHRNFLFLQDRQQRENAGIFVVRNCAVITVAAKGGRVASGPDLMKMNPSMQRNGTNGTNPSMPPPRMMGRDKLIGKTITIRKGPYKGLLGIVKDTSDDSARIELHSKNKIITVSKDILNVKDPITGQSIDISRFSGGRGGGPGGRGSGMGGFGSRGGFDGSRTPSAYNNVWDGGRTPAAAASTANGGRTPAWGAAGAGARTPGWKAGASSGSRTPAAWNDGSRTAYGDGSRTAYGGATSYGGATAYGGSTWNPNSSTPFHSSSSGFAAGSRTPAASWETKDSSSSFTPAHRAWDAPTPGAGFGAAPTPGASGPGALDARTPGASGATYATPGASGAAAYGAAATPGVTDDDDEEGYEPS